MEAGCATVPVSDLANDLLKREIAIIEAAK